MRDKDSLYKSALLWLENTFPFYRRFFLTGDEAQMRTGAVSTEWNGVECSGLDWSRVNPADSAKWSELSGWTRARLQHLVGRAASSPGLPHLRVILAHHAVSSLSCNTISCSIAVLHHH